MKCFGDKNNQVCAAGPATKPGTLKVIIDSFVYPPDQVANLHFSFNYLMPSITKL